MQSGSRDEKRFSKSTRAQTVRVPLDLMAAVGHRLVDTGETFQAMVVRLVRAELDRASMSITISGDPLIPKLGKDDKRGSLQQLLDVESTHGTAAASRKDLTPENPVLRDLEGTIERTEAAVRSAQSALEQLRAEFDRLRKGPGEAGRENKEGGSGD